MSLQQIGRSWGLAGSGPASHCKVHAPVGCVALHPFEGEACEMKRLYVRPEARGHALGRVLVERLIKEARTIGYKRMRLDTVEPIMTKAVLLYRDMGFEEIVAYRENPMEGTLYFELKL